MKNFSHLISITAIFFVCLSTHAQTGINTKTPDASAALEVKAPNNDKGLLIPRMTSAQKNGIPSPATGLLVYDTTTNCLSQNTGTPASPNWICSCFSADNGLTATAGNVQLGGSLTKATALATSSANTLAITGLQAGGATDNVLVADSNGILKMVSRSSLGGADNLGNHTATESLKMANNDIVGAANTSTQTATIAKGTDNNPAAPGYIATSADASGNVVWKPLASVAGSASVAFFTQSTGKSPAGGGSVPGLSGYSYTAPANGKLVLQLSLYTWLNNNGNGSGANPIFTNTQIRILANGTQIAMGMSTPMGSSSAGSNPECATIITRMDVTKGTTYTFQVNISDFYNFGSNGSLAGTYSWLSYSAQSTLMGTLISE